MKKLKKMIVILLALVMVISVVTACGPKEDDQKKTGTESRKATGSQAGEKFKIFMITMDQMDQHWVNVDKGAKKAVDELKNVDYTWLAPDVKDDNKQIECVNNAIAGKAQAILIAANGPDAITSSLKEAVREGIKIVYIDSPANFEGVATLATNNTAAGKTAGEQMLKALDAKGIKEGKIGIISVNTATQSTQDREAGFRAAFEGKGFELLETQYCDGDAARSKDAAANFITEGVVGIFGANEGSTVGTGNAIKEAEGSVIGVGFDKSDKILELIKDGHLLCTMAQNPDVMGYEGVKTAVLALQGKEIPEKNVDTGVSVIDKNSLTE